MARIRVAMLALWSAVASAGAMDGPIPLGWDLIRDSDVVVVGRVARIEPPPALPARDQRPDERFVEVSRRSYAVAVVGIERILVHDRGETEGLDQVRPGGLLRIPYWPQIVCPAPPRFKAGERRLLFLERTAQTPEDLTLVDEVAPVLAADEPTADLVQWIGEARQITAIENAEERRLRRIDWLVRACLYADILRGPIELETALGLTEADPALREGDLDPTEDALYLRLSELTPSQRATLREAYCQSADDDWLESNLKRIVARIPDASMTDCLLTKLGGVELVTVYDAEDVAEIMQIAAAGLAWPDGQRIARDVASLRESDRSDPALHPAEIASLRAVIARFADEARERTE